jgi:orotidine-5'-phosphate decarboxylase
MQNPIILALDVPDAPAALHLTRQVRSSVGAVKVGLELFTATGPTLVRQLRETGVPVFLDLKLHDIPHTVARAVAAAVRLDVQMLTVHTAGGPDMLRAAETSAQETARSLNFPPPLVLGVTVLTSMDGPQLAAVTLESDVVRQVERLARLAQEAGLRGLVCSPQELSHLHTHLPPTLQYVTPGIRLGPIAPGDDQKRTLSATQALALGARWLVIGRPIHAAPDPAAAAQNLWAGLQSAPHSLP